VDSTQYAEQPPPEAAASAESKKILECLSKTKEPELMWSLLCVALKTSLYLAGTLGAAPQSLSESDKAVVKQAVLAVNTEMNAAAAALDVDRFFESILEGPEASIIQDGRLFTSRDEALAAVRQGYQRVQTLSRIFERTEVTVLSREVALLTASGTSKTVLTDGRAFEQPFAVSLVFVLGNGKWKVAQGHYSVPNPR
jgi:hypothetical protein